MLIHAIIGKMASSVTAQSLLGKISKGHLECSICFNRFKEPKVLDCMHSFCLKCLQQLRRCQTSAGSKLRCPVCRGETTLNEIDDLPNNFTLKALVDEVTMQEQLLEGQGSEIKCQACEEQNEAISRCVDCDNFLCQECQQAHQRLTLMKSHKIYTLTQLISGETVPTGKKTEGGSKCGKHPNQNFSVYCTTCEQLVCTTCSILDHTKPEHSLVGLSEALDKCKQDVIEVSALIDGRKKEFNIAKKETGMVLKKLDTNFANTKVKLSKKAEEEIAKIREEEENLSKELEMVYKDRTGLIESALESNSDQVNRVEDKLDEINQLMAHESYCGIPDLRQKIANIFGELKGNKLEKLPSKLSFMDFKEGEESLGKLVLEDEPRLEKPKVERSQKPRILFPKRLEKPKVDRSQKPRRLLPKRKWLLKTRLQGFGRAQTHFRLACSAAAFSDNEIIIVDLAHQQLFGYVLQSDPQSNVIPEGLRIKCTNPSCVAVNKDDQLIVVDDGDVKTFSREYRLLCQFTPARVPNSMPSCLAVDDSNLVAVGYEDREEISLHNQDGSLIGTLPAPMIVEHLAICKRRLIFTNWERRKLSSMDYDGNMIFCTTTNTLSNWGPTGVCCDSDGSIYVAVCGLGPLGEIHHFDPDGKHIRCVTEECGSPRAITFASRDDLVVAEGDSVSIFHYG